MISTVSPIQPPASDKDNGPRPTHIFSFHSYNIAEEIKLKELSKIMDQKPFDQKPMQACYQLADLSYCFIYNFGSIVFFNVSPVLQHDIIKKIESIRQSEAITTSSEEYSLEIIPTEKNKVDFNKVIFNSIDKDKVELIALILAQSTALDHFENKVNSLLGEMHNITSSVKGKRIKLSQNTVLDLIRRIITIKQQTVVSLYLLEKPEATWEKKVLDDLFNEGVMMFELKERFSAMKDKLQTVQDNLEVLSNFSSSQQMLFMEAAIVGLFVLDIILVAYEMFNK